MLSSMRLNSPIPVRFSADLTARLKTVAQQSRSPLSQLIRIATEQFLKKVESCGALIIRLKEPPMPHKVIRKSGGRRA